MVVVLDVKDAGGPVTCLFRCSFKYLRLKRVKGGTGEKITAISHATSKLIPVT
jgi:hypothetical protein